MKYFLILLFVGLIWSCEHKNTSPVVENSVFNTSTDTAEMRLKIKPKKDSKKTYSSFDPKKEFLISNYTKKELDNTKDSSLQVACHEWQLSPLQVKQLLPHFQAMDGPEWHYQYAHLPCYYEADIQQDSNWCRIQLNAGSWMTVQQQDTTVYYGLKNKQLESYFLMGSE